MPATFIYASIGPGHDSKTLLDIVVIFAFVVTSRLPPEFSLAVLHILKILAFILVCILLCTGSFPHTLSVLHSFFKHTTISVTVGPSVLTVALSPTITVFAKINIAVGEDV